MQQGVTATNLNVNIVQWFGDNIFGNLQVAAGGGVHHCCKLMNQVPQHVPLSGVLCFFDAHWLFEPLSPTTAHEGTTGLSTSIST